jgi:hypothetical protein
MNGQRKSMGGHEKQHLTNQKAGSYFLFFFFDFWSSSASFSSL